MVTAETLTDEQLVELFGCHCECRPLDIDRTAYEHSHDCDVDVLDDIQCALNNNGDEESYHARHLCAELINARADGAR
ncbi:MAG: hypothetical protein ACTHU0_18390 [Kofleriaceae bacterium]